jgi:hypothetical protein
MPPNQGKSGPIEGRDRVLFAGARPPPPGKGFCAYSGPVRSPDRAATFKCEMVNILEVAFTSFYIGSYPALAALVRCLTSENDCVGPLQRLHGPRLQ